MRSFGSSFFRLVLATSLALFVIGCSKKGDYDKSKAFLAIDIIDHSSPNIDIKNLKIVTPSTNPNQSWLGGSFDYTNRSPLENIIKTFPLDDNFAIQVEKLKIKPISSSIYFSSSIDHFLSSPAIVESKVFILNSLGILMSYDLSSKLKLWKTSIKDEIYPFSYRDPKTSYCHGKIFTSIGGNKIVAIDSMNGKKIWSKQLNSIPSSHVICDDKLAYVASINNKLYALEPSSGEIIWTHEGVNQATSVFGAADPVLFENNVLISYSSGELYMLHKKSGEVLWSKEVGARRVIDSKSYLRDIDATPIIKKGVVFALSNSGAIAALDAKSGNFLWKKKIGGIANFWLAGDFIFVIDDNHHLLSIHRESGLVKWRSDLLKQRNKKLNPEFSYGGVTMAGGKLIISSNDGDLIFASPQDGKIEGRLSLGKRIFHQPIVVNDKIYIYAIGRFSNELFEIE